MINRMLHKKKHNYIKEAYFVYLNYSNKDKSYFVMFLRFNFIFKFI